MTSLAVSADLRAGRDDRFVRRVVGDDLEDAKAFFSAGYAMDPADVTRTEARFSWEHAAVGDGRMSMRTSRIAGGLRATLRSDDEFIVMWNRSGRTVLSIDGRDLDLPVGRPVVVPMDRSFRLHHTNIAQSLIHLDRSFVEGLVSTSDDPEGGRLEFDPFREPSAKALVAWRAAVRRMSPTYLDLHTPPGPIARRSTAELIAHAMLATFPHRLAAPGGRVGLEIARVRRAVDFIHANARLPIGTAEIAAAADLSARGLQQSFRRNIDSTPGELLRAVRLDGVREQLRQAQPGSVTVAEVARAWGFTHLGRFSASYRSRFGQLPNETLRAHA